MSKDRSNLVKITIFGGVGEVMYLLFQLLLALLVVKNLISEERVLAFQVASGAVSALLCGYLAMKATNWILAACLTGSGIAALTAVLGFGIYGDVLLNVDTLLRILAMLLGGLAPALFVGKKGEKRRAKSVGRRVRKVSKG